MQYRSFGRLDWRPSALGFGLMRLPVIDNQPGRIDEPLATRMVRYAIDNGVNYVDTAYPYHGGQSESFAGRALQHGYRDRVKLATKLPSWLIKTADDLSRYLDEQLERLQTDHIDFYLLHALNQHNWPKLRDLGVLAWAERMMTQGCIHHLGFSFHDNLATFKEIIDAYENWTFCQIQYNYMDIDYQAGVQGLRYAAEKGLGVVIMEPLRGGQLSKTPPERVADLWADAAQPRTPADWALQWVWSQPEVSLLLSGMSTMQHVTENIASADHSDVGLLTDEELALIGDVRDAYRRLTPIPCTNCGYCMPCPNDVSIPRVFEIYNSAVMYDDEAGAQRSYTFLNEENRADACVECRACEERCPQGIAIADWLKKAHAVLRKSP